MISEINDGDEITEAEAQEIRAALTGPGIWILAEPVEVTRTADVDE